MASDKGRPVEGDARLYFLDQLRQARLAAQKDSELFDQLLFVFERLGCFRMFRTGSLGEYEHFLLELASKSPLSKCSFPPFHSNPKILFTLVREARNDALHHGTVARHLTQHAIEFALLLEDALMNGEKPMTKVTDIMVHSPIVAGNRSHHRGQ